MGLVLSNYQFMWHKNLTLILITFVLFCGCKKDKPETKVEAQKVVNYSSTLPDYWKNPEIFQWNREKTRSDFFPFESSTRALSYSRTNSKYYRSLNGFWRYQYFENPNLIPAKIEEEQNFSGWLETSIPSVMELKGFGKPYYKYYTLPFENKYPEINSLTNSVFVFNKRFQLPEDWSSRENYLVFEGVSAGFYLYVNGKLAGYSEDSRSISEFNISTFLKPGENQITAIVFKWTDGSYLEAHNLWHLTGIYRNVYMISRPKINIRDFYAKTNLIQNYKTGTLDLDVFLTKKDSATASNLSLKINLYQDSIKLIRSTEKKININGNNDVPFNFKFNISDVKAWTDETPDLHDLEIILKDQKGNELEAIRYKIAFTSIEIKNTALLINGKEHKLKGIIRHEHHPIYGYSVDKVWMENDADLMKLNNINTVRNSHYSVDPYWYEITSKYGLNLVDEVNAQSLLLQNVKSELIKKQLLFRTQNMFERNKNHQHIICWSLGKHKRSSQWMQESYDYIKKSDPKRPVSLFDSDSTFGDIHFCMPGNESKQKPTIYYVIVSNFGNALGGLDSIWKNVQSSKNISGGFVEDWTDQCFMMKNKNGVIFWAYGGDFGEGKMNSDSFYCARGVMSANKTPKPSFFEMKHIFRPLIVSVKDIQKGIFTLKNTRDFSSPETLNLFYSIEEDGQKISEQKIDDVKLVRGGVSTFKINYGSITPKAGKEYYIKFIVNELKHEKGMVRYLLRGFDQFKLPFNTTFTNQHPIQNSQVTSKVEANMIVIQSERSEIKINQSSGWIESINYKNESILKSPLKPYFWRVPGNTDLITGFMADYALWQYVHDSLILLQIKEIKRTNDLIEFQAEFQTNFPAKMDFKIIYSINATGGIKINSRINPPANTILHIPPRFAFIASTSANFGTIEWFGRGVHENYADRKSGAAISRYKIQVKDFLTPDVRPQEMGNRTDVRWFSLNTFEEVKCIVSFDSTGNFCFLPFNYLDLTKNLKHLTDVQIAPYNSIIISKYQLPLGSWNIPKKTEGTLFNHPMEFEFYIKMTDSKNEVSDLAIISAHAFK
ncbi:MAG: hypothetical protein M3Q56_10310 [Bacteroidota bacterium]|nr:hypothetical protein [Bacteroidota bacterium]